MGIVKDFKIILKSVLLGILSLISLALVFMGSYSFIEYQRYLSAYQATQQIELSTLQQKTANIIETLKQLSQLTSTRIVASHGDIKRTQNVLSSVPRFNPQGTLPKLQKVFYNKFSRPQMIITLFGPFPLHSHSVPDIQASEKEASIIFGQEGVISKTPVVNAQGDLEGVLGIQIDPSNFKASLGSTKTLTFEPVHPSKEVENKLLQNRSFPIYTKPPNNFWNFALIHKERYAFFYYFTIVAIIFIIIYAVYFNFRNKKTHKARGEELEADLLQLSTEVKDLKEELLAYQQNYKSYQTSCEAYKAYSTSLKNYQKEQAAYIERSLSVVEQSLRNPKSQLSKEEQAEIIKSCLKAIYLLSNSLISKTKNEPVDIRTLLEESKLLFAEKIYKSKLTINFSCFDDVNFYGDSLFTKFILMNVIGKSIYSLSKNGRISVIAKENDGTLEIEIRDNGYSLADTTEGLMEKYPTLFVKEDFFPRLCQSNGVKYETSRAKDGLNVTQLIISGTSTEMPSNNVIQLFPS